jgi:hypothetical protein
MPVEVVLVVLIVFTAISLPFIIAGLVYFGKKKLEHKTLVAAIEKGVPVSELNLSTPKDKKNDGPGWVQDQSKAITLLIIGSGISVAFWFLMRGANMDTQHIFWVLWIIPIVFLANGIGLLIRSIQRRKYEKPEPAEEAEETQITMEDTL